MSRQQGDRMQAYHRAVGRTQGIREAFPEGYREGLGLAIDAACDILGLKITHERRGELDTLDLTTLEALLSHLRRKRRWPDTSSRSADR